ncbi:MAG: hypothetical protein FWF79_10490 [Defluviitaleaceae bacterium]|nr:hypothetical protein [Defluviitaleaceae bacterium]
MNWRRIIAVGTVAGMLVVTGCSSNMPETNQGNRNGQRVADSVNRRGDSYRNYNAYDANHSGRTTRGMFGRTTRGARRDASRETNREMTGETTNRATRRYTRTPNRSSSFGRPQNRIGTTVRRGYDRGVVHNIENQPAVLPQAVPSNPVTNSAPARNVTGSRKAAGNTTRSNNVSRNTAHKATKNTTRSATSNTAHKATSSTTRSNNVSRNTEIRHNAARRSSAATPHTRVTSTVNHANRVNRAKPVRQYGMNRTTRGVSRSVNRGANRNVNRNANRNVNRSVNQSMNRATRRASNRVNNSTVSKNMYNRYAFNNNALTGIGLAPVEQTVSVLNHEAEFANETAIFDKLKNRNAPEEQAPSETPAPASPTSLAAAISYDDTQNDNDNEADSNTDNTDNNNDNTENQPSAPDEAPESTPAPSTYVPTRAAIRRMK